jgi:Leucine-rich repeat (LRR) protein
MHIPELSESKVPRPFLLLYYLCIVNMLDASCCVQTLLAHTNLMETVPDDLANLKNMTILVLSFNSFSEFPAMLCDMTQVLEPKLATRYRIVAFVDEVDLRRDLFCKHQQYLRIVIV